MDGTLIPTADMTKIKQSVISGLNYFKQNCLTILRPCLQAGRVTLVLGLP